MRSIVVATAVFVTVIAAVAPPVGAQVPDREGLLQAWEQEQRADSRVSRFEDLGEGRYHLTTDRFPYDGVVVVNEVVVDDSSWEAPYGVVVGHVVVDLPDLDDDELARHATSIGLWRARNIFYWDPDGGGWIGAAEWSRRAAEDMPGFLPWVGVASSGVWILFLVVLVVVLALVVRKANRQMKSAMAAQDTVLAEQQRALAMQEEGLELMREQSRLLAAILEELGKR